MHSFRNAAIYRKSRKESPCPVFARRPFSPRDPFVQHSAVGMPHFLAEYNAVKFRAPHNPGAVPEVFVTPGSGSSTMEQQKCPACRDRKPKRWCPALGDDDLHGVLRDQAAGRDQLSARLRLSVLGAQPPAGGRAASPGTGRLVHPSDRLRADRHAVPAAAALPVGHSPTCARARCRSSAMRTSPKRRPRLRPRSRPPGRASSMSIRRSRSRRSD